MNDSCDPGAVPPPVPDPRVQLARDTYVRALVAADLANDLARRLTIVEVAQAARAAPASPPRPSTARRSSGWTAAPCARRPLAPTSYMASGFAVRIGGWTPARN